MKAWYQEKYGEPMTDFELSVTKIKYRNGEKVRAGNDAYHPAFMTVTRTAEGADFSNSVAVYKRMENYSNSTIRFNTKLKMEDWAGLVRDISELGIDEWEEEYANNPEEGYVVNWNVEIISSDTLKSQGEDGVYPENWKVFKDIMDNLWDKIETELQNEKEKADAALKARYLEKFGEPITDRELSTTRIVFEFNSKRAPKNSYYLSVYSEAVKAGAWAELSDCKDLEWGFDMDEWLELVRVVYKTNFYEWKHSRSDWSWGDSKKFDWKLIVFNADEDNAEIPAILNQQCLEYRGADVYPPNWKELKRKMDVLRKEMRKDVKKFREE
jgi:hypothetical protein